MVVSEVFDRDLLERSLKWVKAEHERPPGAGDWNQRYWTEGLRATTEVFRRPMSRRYVPDSEVIVEELDWRVMETGCGTAYCVAGHVVHEAGDRFVTTTHGAEGLMGRAGYCVAEGSDEVQSVGHRAIELLGITLPEADALFAASNTYEEVVETARRICENHGEELSFDE